MSKVFFSLIAFVFFLISCSDKDEKLEQPEPEGELFSLNFNIEGFEQTVESMSLKSESVQTIDDIRYIDYLLLNSNGDFLKKKSYTRNDANFGKIEDQLLAGKYICILLANNAPEAFNPMYISTKGNYYLGDSLYIRYGDSEVYDTFESIVHITVQGTTQESVSLSRCVGRVEVTITDAIPSDAYNLELVMYKGTNQLTLSSSNQWLTSNSNEYMRTTHIFSNEEKGTTNFKLAFNSFWADGRLTANCYNMAGDLIATKKIANPLAIQPRMRYRYSGALFTAASQNNGLFDITIAGDYGKTLDFTF